ncbi:ribbon-helix-helix domain-containing protein [Agromyces silvae]|uniref:ribbon-helix-helix domain-containing protein n=1 Tax=Agromyces silvae TaxID=3388266 RepID=UPI00280BED34|nr:ribbon-helix-helix domain-containing protein [Agromyces protaetiae]
MSRSHGTVNGAEISEDVIDRLVANAEAGFPGVTARRAGRPTMGEGPATTVAVRLDPTLHQALVERVEGENSNASQVIRDALREYLHVA